MEEIRIEHLTFTYAGASSEALQDISLRIRSGEFICICGPSGCGKSTLLRQLKPAIMPGGLQKGNIYYDGRLLSGNGAGEKREKNEKNEKNGNQTGPAEPGREVLTERELAAKIGFVHQSPDRQIVSEKACNELAFGLENIGLSSETIRRRIAEIVSFFGMEGWFHKNVNELSGGQKQILNLASVMVMYPEILILDEPTSQLDPIAAREFLDCLARINREFGTAVLLTEHRLEEILPVCDRVCVLDQGKVVKEGSISETGEYLRLHRPDLFLSMPTAMRLWAALEETGETLPPVTAVQGHRWLEKRLREEKRILPVRFEPAAEQTAGQTLLECSDIYFRYEKNGQDILRGVSLQLRSGEMLAVVGANGAGKSTLLSILGGVRKPYRGVVTKTTKTAMLPQQPEMLFSAKTLWGELEDAADVSGEEKQRGWRKPQDTAKNITSDKLPDQSQGEESDRRQKITGILSQCHLEGLEERHPYDLSGGEMQRLALAKILLTEPQILILDEPTKGMDAKIKIEFAAILEELKRKGRAILMVSHDMEFCAAYADQCAMLFDGELVCREGVQQFFCDNHFYTTAARRLSEGIIESAITPEQILEACRRPDKQPGPPEPDAGNDAVEDVGNEETELPEPGTGNEETELSEPDAGNEETELPEPGTGNEGSELPEPGTGNEETELPEPDAGNEGSELPEPDAGNTSGKNAENDDENNNIEDDRDAGRESAGPANAGVRRKADGFRHALPYLFLLLAVPVTLAAGELLFHERKYLFISLLIILEVLAAFTFSYESRKPAARDIVVVSVLCAITVAGRAAFYMFPEVKPVIAMVVISAVALGPETGFLVGAMSMLVSNAFFSQGAWTPWQMFAMGLIGLAAGLLFRGKFLPAKRIPLCIYGFLSAIFIYGLIMNPAAAIMSGVELNRNQLMLYYASGFPMDLVHACATAVFLFLLADPMLEKLERVKKL